MVQDFPSISKPLVAIPVRPVLLGAPDFITPATMAVHEPKVDASSCKVLWCPEMANELLNSWQFY